MEEEQENVIPKSTEPIVEEENKPIAEEEIKEASPEPKEETIFENSDDDKKETKDEAQEAEKLDLIKSRSHEVTAKHLGGNLDDDVLSNLDSMFEPFID